MMALNLIFCRAPDFPPEPPVFDNELDAITAEETPFEVWIYLTAFRSVCRYALLQFVANIIPRSRGNLQSYLTFFNNFLNTCPDYSGAQDDSDVLPPAVTIDYPEHFNKTFVHFLPQVLTYQKHSLVTNQNTRVISMDTQSESHSWASPSSTSLTRPRLRNGSEGCTVESLPRGSLTLALDLASLPSHLQRYSQMLRSLGWTWHLLTSGR